MSVATPYRKPLKEKLEVELKCAKLYAHALHSISPKSKIGANVPKILKSRIESSAYNAMNYVNAANKQRLDIPAEREERRKLQARAKESLNEHQTALDGLHAYRRLPDRKLIYWFHLIENANDILERWVKSDEKRI